MTVPPPDSTCVTRSGICGLTAELRTGFYTRQAFVVRPSGRTFGWEVSRQLTPDVVPLPAYTERKQDELTFELV